MNRIKKKERAAIVARIEYPVLARKVKEELGRKKIPYLLRTQLYENILTVQVVNEYFFDIPVTLENVERVTGLMNYFLIRPDCAKKEMPEIRPRIDYGLAKSWKCTLSDERLSGE